MIDGKVKDSNAIDLHFIRRPPIFSCMRFAMAIVPPFSGTLAVLLESRVSTIVRGRE